RRLRGHDEHGPRIGQRRPHALDLLRRLRWRSPSGRLLLGRLLLGRQLLGRQLLGRLLLGRQLLGRLLLGRQLLGRLLLGRQLLGRQPLGRLLLGGRRVGRQLTRRREDSDAHPGPVVTNPIEPTTAAEPPPPPARSSAARVPHLCVAWAVAGALAVAVTAFGTAHPWAHLGLAALLVAAAATLQVAPIRLGHEAESENLHLDEAFLVPMAVYLSTPEVAAGIAVAAVVGNLWHRRGWLRTTFNTGQIAATTSVGATVAHAVGAGDRKSVV